MITFDQTRMAAVRGRAVKREMASMVPGASVGGASVQGSGDSVMGWVWLGGIFLLFALMWRTSDKIVDKILK